MPYKVAPDNQSSWPYDAVTVLAAAINKAGSTDPAKIREAILAIKKFPGAEGEYNFDQNGDGLHGYNIVKNDKGNDRLRQAHRLQRLIVRSSAAPAPAGEARRVSPVESAVLSPNACHGSCPSTAVYRHRHRRRLCAGRARFRADLPRHQRGEFRARRILDGRRLSDGGVRRRSGLALLAVIPDRAGRHGAARRRSSISASIIRCGTAPSCR